jgi:acetate kinase
MEKKYLIVNRGSASEKYAIYTKEKRLAFLHIEKAENDKCDYVSTLFINETKEEKCVTKKEFNDSLNYAMDIFFDNQIIVGKDVREAKKEIVGMGIRIVAPGKHFQDDKVIDGVYEVEIKKVIHDAPLHLKPTYEMIKLLQKTFKNIPIVGISDSDFHDTIPDKAKYYGISTADTKKHQIQKYGYHGISVESILNKLKTEGPIPEKLIICHIGSGVSVTAIKDGKSIENSMGYTPLEGVMMATRGGDIDPGTVAIISDSLGWFNKTEKLKQYLNKECGLLGVSGKSSDVRDLIKLEKEGDTQAKLALDMYAYKIQKYIGSYFVVLGGLDTIIFTATVGERSFIMRERICTGLEVLGVKINNLINNQSEGIDVDISAGDSKVKVLVRKTDEMGQIATDTINTLKL